MALSGNCSGAVCYRMVAVVKLVIYGEPASKANSRENVNNPRTGKPMFIKSTKARKYVDDLKRQVAELPELMEGDLVFTATIYYASRRPDLDESLILDGLQGLIYKNDRQVKAKHVFWALDKHNPRAEVEIEEWSAV